MFNKIPTEIDGYQLDEVAQKAFVRLVACLHFQALHSEEDSVKYAIPPFKKMFEKDEESKSWKPARVIQLMDGRGMIFNVSSKYWREIDASA